MSTHEIHYKQLFNYLSKYYEALVLKGEAREEYDYNKNEIEDN